MFSFPTCISLPHIEMFTSSTRMLPSMPQHRYFPLRHECFPLRHNFSPSHIQVPSTTQVFSTSHMYVPLLHGNDALSHTKCSPSPDKLYILPCEGLSPPHTCSLPYIIVLSPIINVPLSHTHVPLAHTHIPLPYIIVPSPTHMFPSPTHMFPLPTHIFPYPILLFSLPS